MKQDHHPSQKSELKKRRAEERQRLKSLEREEKMIDDHGPAIIGRRDRQPNLDDA